MTYAETADVLLMLASGAVAVGLAWHLHRQAVARAYAEGFRAGKKTAAQRGGRS